MRHMADRPWLRPKAQEAFLETLVADALMEPLQWSASLRLLPLRRAWLTGKHNLSVLAALHDVRYLHPLMDETFVTAVSRGPRILGYMSRTDAMRALFGQFLPREIIARKTKALFNQAHVRRYTRDFALSWDGTGVDVSLVEPNELKRAGAHPTYRLRRCRYWSMLGWRADRLVREFQFIFGSHHWKCRVNKTTRGTSLCQLRQRAQFDDPWRFVGCHVHS